jgi:aldo/keto reductase family protein
MEDLGRILVVATVSGRLGVCEERRVALGPLLHRDGGAFCPAGALQLRTEERCERDQVADLVPASPFSVEAGVLGAIGGLEHAEVDTSHGCAPFLSVLWSVPSRLLPGNGRSEPHAGESELTAGKTRWRRGTRVLDETAAEPIVKAALDDGITFFDTADAYSGGASEVATGHLGGNC